MKFSAIGFDAGERFYRDDGRRFSQNTLSRRARLFLRWASAFVMPPSPRILFRRMTLLRNIAYDCTFARRAT